MGIKGKKKELDHADSQSEEYLADNNEDQDTIKEEEIVYYRARRMIPVQELKVGMARFTSTNVTRYNIPGDGAL